MTSATLEAIIAHGNNAPDFRRIGPNRITCTDGFSVSVLAGAGCYCTPRPDYWPFEGGIAREYSGPYSEVEVGFPSEPPAPWDSWETYAEEPDRPTETVYSYVPVQLVRDLIEAHGGEKAQS